MGDWTVADVPGQQGRTAVVTGANSGIGYWAALALARRGAVTVLACRDAGRGKQAAARIEAAAPDADVRVVALDLASLASVRDAAAQITAQHERLDLLINNAGLMMPPAGTTADGFELQFGTNHLGHFALTGALLPRMLRVAGSRVVTVSSNAHRTGRIDFTDLNWQRRAYRRLPSYAQSKLANLLFTFELDRRLRAAGRPVSALAAHPGYAGTHLVVNGRFGRSSGGAASILDAVNRRVSQSPEAGAWPTLMAATADLPGSTYCGPSGLGESAGPPQLVGWSRQAGDVDAQRALWDLSEETTGIRYP
jgi:NAD(P)-dependent dehydrogenase (short-subunit alcohol dehydrogenase family)